MVNLLLPITFFSKNYTNSLTETMTMVACPVFVLIILLQLFRDPKRINQIVPSMVAVILTAFFWVLQLIVMLCSYLKTGETQVTSGIFHSSVLLAGWTLTVYISWAVIQLTVDSVAEERSFVKSGLIALVIYGVVILFPQMAAMFHVTRVDGYVEHLASLFERHWRVHDGYDFYKEGSYVMTQGRVNGFEPESAFLANLLGVVYLPIVIGLVTTKQIFWRHIHSRKFNIVLNALFAFSIIGMLLLAKTTTGILTAGLGILLWIFWSKGGQRWSLILMTLLGLGLLAFAYFKSSSVRSLFNHFLFNKQNTDNRLGGTIGLLMTFLKNPLFGVGYGFNSYYILQNVPLATTQNFEFQQVYSQFGYPNLSDLLGWFASFGIVIMFPALWLLGRLLTRSYRVQRVAKLRSVADYDWDRGLHISFITMVILATFSSIFVIQIFLWPYLLMFFFYRKHIMRLEQEYNLQ